MVRGKLVVFEGIYGSGRFVVGLVNRLREALAAKGTAVYEIDSPDSGRAQIMGAAELDSSWRYGLFKPDFFHELASRARVCSVINQELENGKLVLCKNFTMASIAYAALAGHDWFREDLNVLEARARGLGFGREIVPDLTVFLDVAPDVAMKDRERIADYFEAEDLVRQRGIYLDELARLPEDKAMVLAAERHEDANFDKAFAAIRALLA